jgi:NodT family efflux transporter outer membrane factor (OMF) lipoprotein
MNFIRWALEVTCKTTVPQKIDDFGANSQGQLAGLKTCRGSLAQAGKRGGGGENWRQKGDFMRRTSFAIASLVLAMLTACAVGPDYERPDDPLPEAYTEDPAETPTVETDVRLGEAQSFVGDRDLPLEWWELFQSEPLNELVEASLIQNPNVAAAQAALLVGLENVRAQVGYFSPTFLTNFMPTQNKTSQDLSSNTANNAYYYNLYTAQVAMTYTVDVFGSNKRQVESLRAEANSYRFNLEATYLTLTSNVVNAAILEASLRGQIAATQGIIAIQSNSMKMFEQLYNLGQISMGDLALQQAALAAAESTLPPLEKQLAIQRDLLHVLVGLFPSDTITAAFDLDSFDLPTELPLALPSTLVERRPDVRAAEELLHAASADIGVARANRLPILTLSADNYGVASTRFADLFLPSNIFWEIGGNIAQTVFDGGTLAHREASAIAAYDQAAAQYRATVLNAFQNVADALHAIRSDADALQAAGKAKRAAEKSLTIARGQLAAGDVSILILLQAEQVYQQALLNVVQAQANRLSDTVALFQALGGGWWNPACCESP